MPSTAKNPDQYINDLPEDRKNPMQKLRKIILKNIPKGFEEAMSYGMLGYVIPHSIYPDGYHCDPKLPLPFITIASQKNFIAVYHMGLYADAGLLEWFASEFPKFTDVKLDMGKSCIRFKNPDKIPFELFGKLAAKMTVKDWIKIYEHNYKPATRKR